MRRAPPVQCVSENARAFQRTMRLSISSHIDVINVKINFWKKMRRAPPVQCVSENALSAKLIYIQPFSNLINLIRSKRYF